MARDFDGLDDEILATITAVGTGDWTIAAWGRPDTAGENNLGQIMHVVTSGAALTQRLGIAASTRTLIAVQQWTGGTVASSTTTTTIAASAWSCVVATYRASDATVRIYIGTQSGAMAEAAYASQNAGTGTRSTAGTTLRIGNSNAGNVTWDGRIALPAFDAREWSLAEMEAFRLGRRPMDTGALRGFWPLDSPTATVAYDLSGRGANGTVTGAVVAEGPPIPYGWGTGPLFFIGEDPDGGGPNTLAQRFYHSTTEQDFTAASEVDIRKLLETAPGTNATTICSHPNAAGTTAITLDPYSTRATTGDIRANAGWAINRLGSDGMESEATAKRIVLAGDWRADITVTIPVAGNVTGTLTCTTAVAVYRVSSAGARTLLFSFNLSAVASSGVDLGPVTAVATGTSSQSQVTLEADETLHFGILSTMVQVAGLLGATVSATATYTVGTTTEFLEVAPPGVRTQYPRDLGDSSPATDDLTRLVTFPRALADSAPSTDSVSRVYVGARALADSAPASDDLTRIATFPRALADDASVTDGLTRVATFNRGLADSAPASDVLERVLVAGRVLADSAPASDSLGRVVTYARTLEDNLLDCPECLPAAGSKPIYIFDD